MFLAATSFMVLAGALVLVAVPRSQKPSTVETLALPAPAAAPQPALAAVEERAALGSRSL
jgi:hypothetical protein